MTAEKKTPYFAIERKGTMALDDWIAAESLLRKPGTRAVNLRKDLDGARTNRQETGIAQIPESISIRRA